MVERVRAAEQDRTPGSTALTEAVARYLYKLMAYKDEYEVARLALEPSLGAGLEAEFGPGARASWRLHPPVLRALGMKRKIALGPWFVPAFRALRAMRGLRGTSMDPFGRTRVRVARARADRGVPRPGRSPDRPPQPGHRGAGRAAGRAAR